MINSYQVLELAEKYWKLHEERREREVDPEERREIDQISKEWLQAHGREMPTEEEKYQSMQNMIGDDIWGLFIDYGKTNSWENKGNLEGLVIKFSENNSFNKEILDYLSDLYVEKDYTEFYELLHKELVEYIENNPSETVFSKIRVNENEDIEFYDFKEYTPFWLKEK